MSLRGIRGKILSLTIALALTAASFGGEKDAPAAADAPHGSDGSILTLRGHERWISTVAFSPDGNYIVSGDDDGALKIWDAHIGKELATLRAGPSAVTAVAWSPDGKRILAGNWDGALQLWDSHHRKELSALPGHAETVTSVAFSPNGKRIASGSADETLKVWDSHSGEELLSLTPGGEYDVTSVAFSPDSKRIVSGDGENALRVWDAQSGEELMELLEHDATIACVAFDPAGKRIASGSSDGTLKLWDSQTGKEQQTLRAHTDGVTSVAFSPDGRRLASSSDDDAVKLWDAVNGKELLTFRGHTENVTCIAFSPDGKRLVSASKGVLKIWRLPEWESAEFEPISGVYYAAEVSGSPVFTASGMAWWNDRLIVAERVPSQLRAFTPPDRFEVFKTLTHPVGAAVDPDGHLIVTEKEKDVLCRVARLKRDGSEETLAASTVDVKQAPAGVGTPHFLAVHPNGTIYWSGFPDGGTRYLLPKRKDVIVAQPRIVHTYGIGLSPKHDWLYVNSKVPNPDRRGTWRFPVAADGSLGAGEFFIQIDRFTTTHLAGLPAAQDGSASLVGWVGRLQGLAVDKLGYIYVAGAESHHSGNAVAVFSPDGKQLVAMVLGVPRNISGLAFGGLDGRTLFVTGAGEYKLFQAKLPVPGETHCRHHCMQSWLE